MGFFDWITVLRPKVSEPSPPAALNDLDRYKLRTQLRVDEGVRRFPYTDTVGKLSIGVGRNLTDVGLSESEIDVLLDNDIDRSIADLDRYLPWWRSLDEPRQRVLANMAFNMGIGAPGGRGLRSFVNTLESIRTGDYEAAARGMEASLWYRQTGDRARRLVAIMRTGRDT